MSEQLSLSFDLAPKEQLQLWSPDDIFESLTSTTVLALSEDKRVERKGASVQPRALGDYLCMWSNTQPHGGVIIVGVEDSGKITGCATLSQDHLNRLESLSDYCPDARWYSKRVSVKDSKGRENFIIAYRVHYREDKLVETTAGNAFLREADKKRQIDEALKREIRIAKGEIHYELEGVSLIYPQDFALDEIGKFCRSFAESRRFQTSKTAEEILELAKLGKQKNGKFLPNLACALIFASDPREAVPGARIRVIRYEGVHEDFGNRLNSVFSVFVDGCIPKMLAEVKQVISTQMRSFTRLGPNGRFQTKPEYPEEAWFEAIVNAVAHRSYNFKTQNIFVKLFDDKFVVESPGGFVPPTTAETVYNAHNPRNPFLMEALMHLDLTFCGFEGTRRMRQAMHNAGLPEPLFRQHEVVSQHVHVTLQNNIQHRKNFLDSEAIQYLKEDQYLALTTEEKQIVNYLAENSELNVTSASMLVNKSWPTTNKLLSNLLESGVIELASKRGRKHDSSKTYRLKRSI